MEAIEDSVEGEDDNTAQEYYCPICQEVLKTPIRTKNCRHVFCKSCFVTAVKTQGLTCPMCRGPVREDEKRAADIARQMREKRGSCRACGTLSFLSKMRAHYKYCRKYIDEFGHLADTPSLARAHGRVDGSVHATSSNEIARIPAGQLAQLALPVRRSLRVEYTCPYCPLQGFSDMALVQHCLGVHTANRSPVVCPICASASWGNASFCSRDFIGHLRARHRFSYNLYMNVHEDEDAQLYLALQQSILQGI